MDVQVLCSNKDITSIYKLTIVLWVDTP